MGNTPCHDHICALGYDRQAAIDGLKARLVYNNKTVYTENDQPCVLDRNGRTKYYFQVTSVANRSNQRLYHCQLVSRD